MANGQKVKLFFEGNSRDCHFSSLIEATFWAYFAPSCLDKELDEDLQSLSSALLFCHRSIGGHYLR